MKIIDLKFIAKFTIINIYTEDIENIIDKIEEKLKLVNDKDFKISINNKSFKTFDFILNKIEYLNEVLEIIKNIGNIE